MAAIDSRLVLDVCADAVVAADGARRIVYLNPAAEGLLGWSAGDLVGQPLAVLISASLLSELGEGPVGDTSDGVAMIHDRRLRGAALHRDGREVEVDLHWSQRRAGPGDDLFVASLRDCRGSIEAGDQPTVARYLRATSRAIARLGSRLDLDDVLGTVVETLVGDFGAALARVWIYEPGANRLVLRASAGLSQEIASSSRAQIDVATYPYMVAEVARRREPFVRNGLEGDPRFDREWIARERIAGLAAFPLLVGGELRGVLASFAHEPMSEALVDALTAFVAIVTATVNDVQLFAREQAARVEAEQQRAKLQAILDLLPIGVALAEGPEGRLTVINAAGREIHGGSTTPGSLDELGTSFPITTADGRPYRLEDRPLWRALHRGERVRETARYRRPDGREALLEMRTAPFPAPDGGAVAAFRDVTAQVRLESELAERAGQLKALLDHLPVGVAYFDGRCICRAANGPARRILGRPRDEILGVPADALFAQAPALGAAVRRSVDERTPHVEASAPWRNQSGGPKARHLDWRFEPLPAAGPEPPGVLALIVDVTDRKRAEDELRAAKEAAEQTARNKTRFLSAVSHDLRTPVNALSLQAELLAHVVAQPAPDAADLRDLAADLRRTAANLIELINDLLDLARFDSGDIEHHRSDFGLDEWLATTLEPLRLTAEAKGLALAWHVDRTGRVLHADRVKLGRVLTNLAGNAVKFADAGSVDITVGPDPDGWLALSIRDTGPGIPQDQLGRIFDEFEQLRNPERDRTKGTGLGLAICKRLVEAVGGRLSVSSRPGRGSTFTALYPPDHLNESVSVAARDRPRPGVRTPPKAPILLVEDDPSSRQALTRLLEHVGIAVVTASDGPAALEVLGRARPSLVLLDLMLPGMDGAEVLRRIRQDPAHGSLPVVLLTGDIDADRSIDLKALGVAHTLAKPVDFDELVAVIGRHSAGPSEAG